MPTFRNWSTVRTGESVKPPTSVNGNKNGSFLLLPLGIVAKIKIGTELPNLK
jgi:hypothetical protein